MLILGRREKLEPYLPRELQKKCGDAATLLRTKWSVRFGGTSSEAGLSPTYLEEKLETDLFHTSAPL